MRPKIAAYAYEAFFKFLGVILSRMVDFIIKANDEWDVHCARQNNEFKRTENDCQESFLRRHSWLHFNLPCYTVRRYIWQDMEASKHLSTKRKQRSSPPSPWSCWPEPLNSINTGTITLWYIVLVKPRWRKLTYLHTKVTNWDKKPRTKYINCPEITYFVRIDNHDIIEFVCQTI